LVAADNSVPQSKQKLKLSAFSRPQLGHVIMEFLVVAVAVSSTLLVTRSISSSQPLCVF
jgi:hypothetical protein